MYGNDPRDYGMGPQEEWVDDARDTRPKTDDEEAQDTNRPRTMLYNENFNEE